MAGASKDNMKYNFMGERGLNVSNIKLSGNNDLWRKSVLHVVFRQPRRNFAVATKWRLNMDTEDNKNAVGLSPRHVTSSIENRLKRLRTDYVDIYQVKDDTVFILSMIKLRQSQET
ncbi:4-deoxy-l-erythro-5-hexoseulose uronic acid reductase [Plakobranchus ocellatus]|uniref:4-deoxy-l-erythro-5-hexoseulose uronic acid reductase n=1 Tax=Plakobranchus ocellatus TaxID=259542 RepID=A0AAV4AMR4_9GAST|nr:4-deoxy-l-erythro-5-hexoseulose uronic acid reductase [Plakobranchus ocellatus]